MAAPSQDSPMLAAALEYAQVGWRVFPLLPGDKIPFKNSNGCTDATTDLERITSYWSGEQQVSIDPKTGEQKKWAASLRANIGFATGEGLIVLDVDAYKGASIEEWRLPPTLTTLTARGGYHYFFSYEGEPLFNVPENKLAKGVCVKSDGGYVVAPPSAYQGKLYRFADVNQPIVQLPERIATLIRNYKQQREYGKHKANDGEIVGRAREAQRWLDQAMAKTRDGNGDPTGYDLAVQLLANKVDQSAAWDALMTYARLATVNHDDPFTERDVERWWKSASGSRIVQSGEPARSQRSVAEARTSAVAQVIPAEKIQQKRAEREKNEADPAKNGGDGATTNGNHRSEHRTDMGNARRFVAHCGANVRYVAPWKEWLMWDGRRWRRDETHQVMRLAKETVRHIYEEAESAEDEATRKELFAWAIKSESNTGIMALIAQAKSEPEIAIQVEELDTHPWLLNVLNGTLDLYTGKLHPHRREDYLMKLAPVVYDAQASLQLWNDFLISVTNGNQRLIDFLRRAVGYTLTGDTREDKFFMALGPSRTGKSTFLRAIKETLGDYAMTSGFETFLAKPTSNAPRDDVADMAGKRLVVSIEVDDGKQLAEGLMKTLTGYEPIKARRLYQNGFEFMPTFKIWLAANHAPKVDLSDDAMWNRILRIAFTNIIPKGERKASVRETLTNPKKAGAAILAWAVQGCLEWQQQGLNPPQEIEDATDAYRNDMDPIREFLADCCELGVDAENPVRERWVSQAALRELYEKWCKANGQRYPASGKKMGDALRRRGCEVKVRRLGQTPVKGWNGIEITTEI